MLCPHHGYTLRLYNNGRVVITPVPVRPGLLTDTTTLESLTISIPSYRSNHTIERALHRPVKAILLHYALHHASCQYMTLKMLARQLVSGVARPAQVQKRNAVAQSVRLYAQASIADTKPPIPLYGIDGTYASALVWFLGISIPI